MNNYATNMTVISNDTYQAKNIANQNYYEISSALHTTLDFHKMIATFSHKIENLVVHSAYVYSNIEFKLEIKQGVFTKNSCSYALKFEEQQLGTLKLMRNSEFHDRELELLETLLCCLIYPLKNATVYHQTLKMAYGDPLEKPLDVNYRDSISSGSSFSSGINAQIEYNRNLAEKSRAARKQRLFEEQSPWAMGFYR
jgi:hypothetical protein